MGRSRTKRSSLRRLDPPHRQRPYESSLDRAAGFELDWKRVPPVFEQARKVDDPCFVYFIGEADGPLKIGTAKDPICRLRELQTGNSRPLSVECVLLGDQKLERLLHEMWRREGFAIWSMRERETEWFRVTIREPLGPILDLATEQQIIALGEGRMDPEELDNIVRLAHLAYGI